MTPEDVLAKALEESEAGLSQAVGYGPASNQVPEGWRWHFAATILLAVLSASGYSLVRTEAAALLGIESTRHQHVCAVCHQVKVGHVDAGRSGEPPAVPLPVPSLKIGGTRLV